MSPARLPGAALLVIALLAGCTPSRPERNPVDVRAHIVKLLPPHLADRSGWAIDLYAAFDSLDIDPSTPNLCAALAVIEQESGFNVDPVVPGLGAIARKEIERRAGQHAIPAFLVRGALVMASHDGKSYDEQLSTVHTEQDLSRLYDEFIGTVPLGRRLLGGANPVHTGGPMQVSITFAQDYARAHDYPYPMTATIRQEVFTRRGGLYFGVAHLLGYPTSYALPLYRFADYNAGFYASRNAAFQQAASIASGIRIPLDGDLVRYGSDQVGATEMAVRALSTPLGMTSAQIQRALRQGETAAFERSALYQHVFALAEQRAHRKLPRAMLPRITLESPKITRKLTTQWFATRVDQRYRRCLAAASRR